MDGTTRIGGGAVSAIPGPSWHAIGTGGGGSDILFQNTSGQISIWEMDGTTRIGGGGRAAERVVDTRLHLPTRWPGFWRPPSD